MKRNRQIGEARLQSSPWSFPPASVSLDATWHRVDIGATEALPASDPSETEDSSPDTPFPLPPSLRPPPRHTHTQFYAGGTCASKTAARRASGAYIHEEGACSTVTQEAAVPEKVTNLLSLDYGDGNKCGKCTSEWGIQSTSTGAKEIQSRGWAVMEPESVMEWQTKGGSESKPVRLLSNWHAHAPAGQYKQSTMNRTELLRQASSPAPGRPRQVCTEACFRTKELSSRTD